MIVFCIICALISAYLFILIFRIPAIGKLLRELYQEEYNWMMLNRDIWNKGLHKPEHRFVRFRRTHSSRWIFVEIWKSKKRYRTELGKVSDYYYCYKHNTEH